MPLAAAAAAMPITALGLPMCIAS